MMAVDRSTIHRVCLGSTRSIIASVLNGSPFAAPQRCCIRALLFNPMDPFSVQDSLHSANEQEPWIRVHSTFVRCCGSTLKLDILSTLLTEELRQERTELLGRNDDGTVAYVNAWSAPCNACLRRLRESVTALIRRLGDEVEGYGVSVSWEASVNATETASDGKWDQESEDDLKEKTREGSQEQSEEELKEKSEEESEEESGEELKREPNEESEEVSEEESEDGSREVADEHIEALQGEIAALIVALLMKISEEISEEESEEESVEESEEGSQERLEEESEEVKERLKGAIVALLVDILMTVSE